MIAMAAGIGLTLVVVAYTFSSQNEERTYSEGHFTVHVLEDNASRFLARVENNGPTLNNAAAIAVKKGINRDCEPQGIVVANFQIQNEGGRLVPYPNSIPGNSSITIDSRQANLNVIPTGPDVETVVYILGLEPQSIRANDLVQKILLQQPNATELELFEDCLERRNIGYPLQLKLVNLQLDTEVYITITGQLDTYETTFSIGSDAQGLSTIFWPASRNDWLSANYTQPAGPAPAWNEPEVVSVYVSLVSHGNIVEFEDDVMPAPAMASLDFFDIARGHPVPSYPKYWEIEIDIENRTIG